MPKYRMKPVEIEAMQWTGPENCEEVFVFLGIDHPGTNEGFDHNELYISTPEGDMEATPGDYILKDAKGGFHLCPEDVFEGVYEIIGEELNYETGGPAMSITGEIEQAVRRRQEWEHVRTGNRILIRRIAKTEAVRPMYREGKPWRGPEALVLSFDTEREWWTTFAAIRRNYELIHEPNATQDQAASERATTPVRSRTGHEGHGSSCETDPVNGSCAAHEIAGGA